MNMTQDIQRIRDQTSRILSPKGLEPRSEGSGPFAGQVWRTLSKPPFPDNSPADCHNEEPFLVLILSDEPTEISGHLIHHVMPIHRECAQAGPDDILLPREVFGYRVVVCAGASVPVFRESLDICVGVLPKSFLEPVVAFQDWLEGSSDVRPQVLTGLPYLDEQDVRWRYKEALRRILWWSGSPGLLN